MATRIRKRCEKCGWTGMVRPRVRRCKQAASSFAGSFACWGHLVAAPIIRQTETGAHDDRLERLLATAHSALDNSVKELRRVTKRISEHQRRIKRLEKRIDQRDHPQPVDPDKPKRRRKNVRVVALPQEAGV